MRTAAVTITTSLTNRSPVSRAISKGVEPITFKLI